MDKASGNLRDSHKEKLLVEAVQSSDTLAFVELLGLYSRVISFTASSFGLPKDEFDDLCQEGRMALYKACMGYDGESVVFYTYAVTCIKNAMTDFASRYGKQKKNESSVSVDEIADKSVSSENVGEKAETKQLISSMLYTDAAGLSDKEKLVIGKAIAGEKIPEIAKSLGDSEKSVQNTLYRARKKLRKFFG